MIAVDTLIYNRSFVDGTVVSNNYQAGEQCAKDLMKRRKKGSFFFSSVGKINRQLTELKDLRKHLRRLDGSMRM